MKYKITGSHASYSITKSGDTWIFTKNSAVVSNGDAVTATGIVNTRIVVEGLISAGEGYAGLQTDGTNVDINVAESGRILSGGYGIYAQAIGSKITIAGRVEGGQDSAALYSQVANVEIDIARGGKVLGNVGNAIWIIGESLHIDNHGTIAADGAYSALRLSGDGAEVHNSGKIRGDLDYHTIWSSGDDTHIVNEKSGTIIGGVSVDSDAGESSRTVNHGNVRDDGLAFRGLAGDDWLKNDGRMTGNISLGAGDDVVDMRGGMLDGEILASAGDDILITDNAKYVLAEIGEGEDIIKSSVSYRLDPTYYIDRLELIGKKNINATGTERGEELWGNSGDNVLNGKGGGDYFDGKGGDDLLKSGSDLAENSFIFRTGYDRDTIQHFDTGLDTVHLDGWKAIDDFDDLLSHARNKGDDVVVSAGKDSLTIMDMNKADLRADDFSFLA